MEVVIRLLPDGRLNIAGTVGDKLQLIGLLESAKLAVLQQPAASPVQVPDAGLAARLLAPTG